MAKPSQQNLQDALNEVTALTHQKPKRSPYSVGDSATPGEADIRFKRLGIRVPDVRAIGKQGYRFCEGHSRAHVAIYWDHIFKTSDIFEVAHQAIYYYQHKSLNRAEFARVRQWINRCDSWEHSDDLSKVYAHVFEESPDWLMPIYETWNGSPNPWKRRQSIVGLLEYAQKRKHVQPFDRLISFVEPLLGDSDYYVQKGVGWTLREIYNVYPGLTLKFINRNLGLIDPLAYSAATEKLDKLTKATLNQQRKIARPPKGRG